MLAANPLLYDGRALRHATALSEAGHQVHAIGVIGPQDRADAVPGPPRFTYQRLRRRREGLVPRLVWVTSALRQRAALRLLAALPPALGARAPLLAELAVAPSGPELAALALVRPCDLIYANDVHTLPAAAWVAALRGVPFLYDARELYEDEDAALSAVQRQARRSVERRLIRRAAAVVTVNELLAQTLARRYAIAPPVVVRNVAPRCALTLPTEPGPAGTLRLLYQSANIGLRQEGTDDLLRAVARTRAQARVTLTLRGGISDEERGRLCRRIAELSLGDAVTLRPPVFGVPALLRETIAGGEELGLAVHPPTCMNNLYTTSGKVFEYQMAGLAVCATDLPGNRQSVAEDAAVFYPHGDDARLAELFLVLARDRRRLLHMRAAARRRALDELNWERERVVLLSACALARTPPRASGSAGAGW